jgi:hypothetical protein
MTKETYNKLMASLLRINLTLDRINNTLDSHNVGAPTSSYVSR